jgi:hypothetical protein
METGVGPGTRVALNADNEPSCRGASIEKALLYAEVKVHQTTGETKDFLGRWIKTARKQIQNDQLEARVDKQYKREYEPHEKHGAKLHAPIREGFKEHLRDEIRNKLKPK